MNDDYFRDIIEKARVFSRCAHDSIKQRRKYTDEPYWVHTEEVAHLVGFFASPHPFVIAAAHLHDTLEDVEPHKSPMTEMHYYGLTKDENFFYDSYAIGRIFGAEVLTMVLQLTDTYTHLAYPDKNREERKKLERARLSVACAEAKTIKLADLISNTKTIVADDPGFAKTYMEEKKLLLPFLKEGDETLYKMAEEQIYQYDNRHSSSLTS